MMGALIKSWRKAWGLEFPFIHVQKPSGGGCAWDPQDPITDKAEPFAPLPEKVEGVRWQFSGTEEHIRLNQYSNVFMSIADDLGSGVHPTNKSGYGARACRVALGAVYGRKLEYYGPVYLADKIEGSKVRISFSHVGQGLAFKHGDKLQGFAIAGDDKVFYWAEAVIDGDTVVLSCDKVSKPVAVRYAWNFPHAWANLFNKDGLPAMPFRTDEW